MVTVCKAVYLSCDRCGEPDQEVGMTTVAEARASWARFGGKSAGGVDICPYCLADDVASGAR